MWQRQIQCAREVGNRSIIAAGWASWMITKSYSSTKSFAFSSLYLR
jgi:hypothetical protein